MKKRKLLSAFILSTVLGVRSLSCNAMEGDDVLPKHTAASSQPHLQIIGLKDESVMVLTLSDIPQARQQVSGLMDDIIRDSITSQHINEMTPREAHEAFYPLLVEKVGVDKAKELAPIVFTEKHFGYVEAPPLENRVINHNRLVKYDMMGYQTEVLLRISVITQSEEPEDPTEFASGILCNLPREINFLPPGAVLQAFTETHAYEDRFPREQDQVVVRQIFSVFGCPPEDEEQQRDFFVNQGHIFGPLSPQIMKDIYEGAKRIMGLTRPGDTILVFGNTPVFLGYGIRHQASMDISSPDFRHIVDFPFSGSPNTMRDADKLLLKDVVTQERRQHLLDRMKAEGLTPEALLGHTLWILDNVASGAGPGYFAETFIRESLKKGMGIPDIRIISTYPLNVNAKLSSDQRCRKITSGSIMDGETGMVIFPNSDEPRFRVPLTVIKTYMGRLDDIKDRAYRVWPEYPASRWVGEYGSAPQKNDNQYLKIMWNYAKFWQEHLTERKVEAAAVSAAASAIGS